MNVLSVGKLLGKFAWEVEDLSTTEFLDWLAFLEIEVDEIKAARRREKIHSRSPKI